ncbi:Fimbrial subunit type 1 precursor [Corynebacterium ciconiae DSM 44920]|uniref:SpaH/EbpB family LPXTG-anchored major pilin n=1 Tax=Corynebacterium ciconiae TaxID=227319 RepID=UPI00036F50D3|nr:SpaH/EbpB family LPXTG-anchored major pilin [Corynebacterium ciconiae]WKD62018.1 Fimbrial subunit type 1 precursor [Corynebacterium ciconiae DSM 44920]
MLTQSHHRMRVLSGWIIGALLLVIAWAPAVLAVDKPQASLIDPSARGELIIHKSLGDPLTQFGDPSNPDADLSREPIPGLTFKIRQITNVDLTTNEGWQELEKTGLGDYFTGGSREAYLGEARTASTDEKGVARFSDLPLGAYFVEEEPSAAQKNSLSLVNPFIVTIPSTDRENHNEWNYTVEVNAKDQRIMANKDVSTRCIKAGDTFNYGISATTPAPDVNGAISRFEIADPLPAEVSFVEGSSKVSIQRPGKELKDVALAAEDYTVVVTNGVAQMSLHDTALTTLAELRRGNPETTVSWTFTVKGPAEATGQKLTNRGYVLVQGYPQFFADTTPGVRTNQVSTRVGDCTPHPTDIPIPVPNPDMPELGDQPGPSDSPNAPGDDGGSGPSEEPGTEPGSAPGGGSGSSSGSSGPLASTGASVIGLVIAGGLLVALGIWMSSRRGRSE